MPFLVKNWQFWSIRVIFRPIYDINRIKNQNLSPKSNTKLKSESEFESLRQFRWISATIWDGQCWLKADSNLILKRIKMEVDLIALAYNPLWHSMQDFERRVHVKFVVTIKAFATSNLASVLFYCSSFKHIKPTMKVRANSTLNLLLLLTILKTAFRKSIHPSIHQVLINILNFFSAFSQTILLKIILFPRTISSATTILAN